MGNKMGNAFQSVQMQYQVHPQRQFPNVQTVQLCAIVLQEVHHTKYLGVTIRLKFPRGQYHEEVEQRFEFSAKKPKVLSKIIEGGCIFCNGEVYPGVQQCSVGIFKRTLTMWRG